MGGLEWHMRHWLGSGGGWEVRRGNSRVKSDENPDTAVGRECFGVRGFLNGKVNKKK